MGFQNCMARIRLMQNRIGFDDMSFLLSDVKAKPFPASGAISPSRDSSNRSTTLTIEGKRPTNALDNCRSGNENHQGE